MRAFRAPLQLRNCAYVLKQGHRSDAFHLPRSFVRVYALQHSGSKLRALLLALEGKAESMIPHKRVICCIANGKAAVEFKETAWEGNSIRSACGPHPLVGDAAV